MKTFLSKAEIRTMTGLVQAKAQIRFLHKIGITNAYQNAAGQVVVYRAWIDKRNQQAVVSPAPMPDFAAMDNV